ncbi:MAG: IPT/TIG domain-containing protein [Acidimicrobiales bacterium]
MAALTGSGLTRRQFLAGAAGVGLAAAAARSPVRGYTAPADSPALVDASSFYGKLMFGYQGWFGTPGDGSAMDQWQHWCRGGTYPSASTIGVDVWPDLREFSPRQLAKSGLAYPDGSPAYLFSSYRPDIVAAHFEWMRTYGIDGVFLQEFVSLLAPGSPQRQFRDGVTRNVLRAAGATGRAIAIMYCISPDDKPGAIVHQVEAHWAAMEPQVVSSPRYLRHEGRPLVALWGFGFIPGAGAGGGTQQEANELLDFFEREGVAVMGGVPTYWREGISDSEPGPAWAAVYRRFAIISPWTVGRYTDPAGALQYAMTTLSDDIAEAGRVGADLVPVVFPGYSARNELRNEQPTTPLHPLNEIPRQGGTFWWSQMKAFRDAGAQMVYGAMFDEADEGTAMFKLAATPARLPVGPPLLPLDADGYSLPSDWYLQLAGAATQRLHAGASFEPNPPLVLPGGAQWPTTVPIPVIVSVSPTTASAGQLVTLDGVGFGAAQDSGYVTFVDQDTGWGAPGNAATFTLDSWSDSQVSFTVPLPSGPPSGPADLWHVVPGSVATITVTNAAGQTSNPANLVIGPG